MMISSLEDKTKDAGQGESLTPEQSRGQNFSMKGRSESTDGNDEQSKDAAEMLANIFCTFGPNNSIFLGTHNEWWLYV